MEDTQRTTTTAASSAAVEEEPYGIAAAGSLFRRQLPEPDIFIVTSGGRRIPAHTGVLASVSPVLENIIYRPLKYRSSGKIIPILGVPCDAVSVFVAFIYSSSCSEEQMEKYDVHLLALGHVYAVPELKQLCIRSLNQRLTIENVVDVLQLSRLCNAPDLYLRCMKLVHAHFAEVVRTEGWRFLQHHDPRLELEVLKFIDEAESRRKRTRRHREEQRVYMELSEAMECLEHICTEGCTCVGPSSVVDPAAAKKKSERREPCSKFDTCRGLQMLICHFAACERRVRGRCHACKSMWQLLRLHSSVCDRSPSDEDRCKVPLCRQFKLAGGQVRGERRRWEEDRRWKVLARKVVSARAMSSLSEAQSKRRRKRPEEEEEGEMVRPRRWNHKLQTCVC